jgi:hypothetical protein
MTHIPTISESPPKDSEDIFRDHNCYRCDNGNHRCVNYDPRRCEYLQARND